MSFVQEVKKIHPLPDPSLQDDQELIVHTPTPHGEEEELHDGGPLLAFSENHEEKAKESLARRWENGQVRRKKHPRGGSRRRF
jgi:hypothetical protein